MAEFLKGHWVMLAGGEYGASYRAQHVRPITGAVGWFQYLSKHAARGVKHYQRSAEGIPQAWQSSTGRMWGKVGDWPVRDKIRVNLQDQYGDGGYFAFRRLVRSWRVADARAAADPRRELLARRMLACNEAKLSRVRGVSEWIPEAVQDALLANLASRGYSVTC